MKESKTLLTKQRDKFASNRQSLETVLGWTIDQYNTIQFETGVAFLERLFPRNTEFEKYYQLYSQAPAFWKWWKIEYAIWEDCLMAFCKQNKVNLTPEIYLKSLTVPYIQDRFESSFQHQFLKHFQATI